MKDINCWESKFEPCFYSNKLINKLLILNKRLNNKININEIKKAIYYAKKYHGKQKRDTGELYYSHPIKVAEMVSNYDYNTNTLVTSILHDTIEDTELTKDMIVKIFGDIIANNVEYLTRVKADRKISSAEIIKHLWANNRIDLLLIKLFDRVHNIQSLSIKNPKNINKIAAETTRHFISLSMYLKSVVPKLNVEDNIINLCYKYLSINNTKKLDLIINYSDNFELPLPTGN